MKRQATVALAFVVLVACTVLLFALNLLDRCATLAGQRILRVGEWAARLRQKSC